MTPRVSWPQALAWRLSRHHLDPSAPGAPDAATVVRDLCGVQSQVPSSADAAIRVRRAGTGTDSEVDSALADGRLIRTWAMRGTLHLLTPDDGPARRTAVSRTAGWIAPVVLRGGRVTGTWVQDGGTLRLEWFAEAGRAPSARALRPELERWSTIAGRPLELVVGTSPRP